MKYIELQVQVEDYPFIVEAIKLRTRAILEGFAMQVDGQRIASQQQAAPQAPKASRTAPFGLKKDGTPKKRPGRPARRK